MDLITPVNIWVSHLYQVDTEYILIQSCLSWNADAIPLGYQTGSTESYGVTNSGNKTYNNSHQRFRGGWMNNDSTSGATNLQPQSRQRRISNAESVDASVQASLSSEDEEQSSQSHRRLDHLDHDDQEEDDERDVQEYKSISLSSDNYSNSTPHHHVATRRNLSSRVLTPYYPNQGQKTTTTRAKVSSSNPPVGGSHHDAEDSHHDAAPLVAKNTSSFSVSFYSLLSFSTQDHHSSPVSFSPHVTKTVSFPIQNFSLR